MFSKGELEDAGLGVPDDFNDRSKEFWSYVEERLKGLSGRIVKVYIESTHEGGAEGLNTIRVANAELHRIVSWLVDRGAEVTATEDRFLVLETESWSDLARQGVAGAEIEMLERSLKDREAFVAKRIDETLSEREMGVLFTSALQTSSLPSDIRVIRMMPFDPIDYLKTWMITVRLQDKQGKDSSAQAI